MSDHTNPNPYNRPMARFTGDRIEVRASALGRCRRALWYSATKQPITNPMSDETKLVLESGNALEPVVVRAMQRRFWTVTPTDRTAPLQVSVEAAPGLTVTGHPDATGAVELFGDEVVIEVKTRGPEAFKRWQTLGAERSHPDSVAQAACYTLGLFGHFRDVVIATLDTGSRRWDYEVIPTERVEQAWSRASARLGELADHLDANGPDPDVLPERDFEATDWQCRSCPYLDTCRPALAEASSTQVDDDTAFEPVSDEEAQSALWHYEEIAELVKSLNADKRESLGTLERWLATQVVSKAQLDGRDKTRTVGLVSTKRYKVDHKQLNALLDPEQRAEIVTESRSEYLRVS